MASIRQAAGPSLFDDPSDEPIGSVEMPAIPVSWLAVLRDEFHKPYFHKLQQFVKAEREQHTVFPPDPDVYNALIQTPYEKVRVVVVGQDPYHDDGQAMGLSFSVPPGVEPPPSLKNIFRELNDDLGCTVPNNGCLLPWAHQGVLLLNTVLTVRAHQAASHQKKGWEQFTDAVLRAVNEKPEPVVFLLWGAHAQKKEALVDVSRHFVLKSAHPSPLSARNGFFGSKPFSRINEFLRKNGSTAIDWQLPNNVNR